MLRYYTARETRNKEDSCRASMTGIDDGNILIGSIYYVILCPDDRKERSIDMTSFAAL